MKLFKGITLLAFVAGALAGCGGTSNQTATLPTVESVALSPLVVGLAPGGTQALTVTATESTGATVTVTSGVTYTSSNSSVATVSAAGVVTAGNSEGTANISATVTIGVNQTLTTTAPAVVTVTPVLDSISVAPAATTLAPGATQQLTVTGHFSGNNQMVLTGGVTFASSSTATATVDANGLVTAGKTAGTATITATDTASGLKATATITVAPTAPTLVSIALAPLTANVAQGGTVQLAVIGTYSDQSQAPLAASGESFTSMSPGVASVNAAGLVTVAANATVGATATIVASDTASGLTTSTANSTVITVTSGAPVTTGILSTGFNSNQTTTTSTSGTGVWSAYFGSSNSGIAGGSGGGYADQSVNPSYEYVYINDTVANLGTYTYQGVGIQPAAGQTVSASGFNSLSFTLSVNAEWLSAGSPNFVVLIATKVTGVSNSSCNPQVAAVVTATSSNPTAYTVPLSAFTKITQNCSVASVTAAQILAAPVTQIDFQADGLGAAITASGLTSNINTTVAKAGTSPATYPTTINVQGTVSFVTATPPPAQLVSIALSPLTATIAAGGTQQLTVTGTYSDNTTAVLPASAETFTSMSPSVATVSAAGLVTVASGATAGATATITATDTASGISTTSATNSVITVATPTTPTTGVLSTGFNSNQTTTTSTAATGKWGTYFGSSDPTIAGGSGGGYADQNTNPSYEYVYINDTVANLGTYTYQGVDIQPATGQTVSSSGFNSLSFTLAVNAEWLSAGTPNFVVLIASNVAGVSSASCNPQVAAVVTATSSNPTAYTVPLTAFTKITQNCNVNTVTIAQILAAPVTQIDFQADGLGAAITASGLTSNINTTVAKAGSSPATYPTTINVQGTVSFVTANTTPPATIAVLSTGFNSNQTTTTSTAATGQWGTYFGSSDPTIAGGSGGGYADQSINPSYEYVYINDTVANLGTYTYQGVDIQPAATQTVGAGTNQHFSFTLAVNAEWLSAGSPNFVVLIASNVAGVSSASCNPQVAAVVTATSSNPTAYTVPLTAFTKITQNCNVNTVTIAQILAAPVTQIDFQADGLGAAITASGLTSNINTTVAKAGSSPATYPTTINVQGTVGFVP